MDAMTITTKEYSAMKGLPKKVESVCPECGKVLEAEHYEKDGKVYSKKTCPEHGEFDCLIWSSVEQYLRAETYAKDGIGLENPDDTTAKGSNVIIKIGDKPVSLKSSTSLANIDLTNRCNMTCPICFAEANSAGYVYEPSFDQVMAMLKTLRDEKPIKCTAVQFSGGEPTIYPRFVDVIKAAKDMGFAQVQVATNGIEFAKSVEFCQKVKDAGLNTIYLSFDGVTDEPYIQARNRKMFHVKLQVLDNLRKIEHPPSVVLVPTIVKGVNDHQIGDIIKFAFDNSDIIRGVNFQPVSFTGRITREELEKGRYTIPDLMRDVQEQTGYAKPDDWFPVPVVSSVSKYASAYLGRPMVTFTAHPHCGMATYILKGEDGEYVPMPRFIDVKKFVMGLDELADAMEKARFKKWQLFKLVGLLNTCIDEDKMPKGMKKKDIVRLIKGVMSDSSKKTLAGFSWNAMYIGAMHFQDAYNYDIERVERCAIHYVTPDLRVIPFCAYNGGPYYRMEIEKKYSMPIAEWKEKHKEEAKSLENALIVPEDQRPDQ